MKIWREKASCHDFNQEVHPFCLVDFTVPVFIALLDHCLTHFLDWNIASSELKCSSQEFCLLTNIESSTLVCVCIIEGIAKDLGKSWIELTCSFFLWLSLFLLLGRSFWLSLGRSCRFRLFLLRWIFFYRRL